MLKSIKLAKQLRGKRVILRVAYDVPIKEINGKTVVADDTRIKASIPSLKFLLKNKCKIVILTWLGRPGGEVVNKYKLDPVAQSLSKIIKKNIVKLDSTVGREVLERLDKMKQGEIILVENVRFNKGEESNDPRFADELSKLGELVVFDAFAQSHRDCPSTTGILARLPSYAGINMEREVKSLSRLINKPKHPFVVILGGAKVSDKLGTLLNMIKLADVILIGGAMAHNFLKAQGIKVGASLVESQSIGEKKEKQSIVKIAEDIIDKTKDSCFSFDKKFTVPQLVLPLDLIAAQGIEKGEAKKIININKSSVMPNSWMYLDIGPETINYFSKIIKKAAMIFWNGPLGYFESKDFSTGTRKIANAVAGSSATTIVAGGDTEVIVEKYNLEERFSHVSTGGGAALEFLAGKELPVIKYLSE